jgi:hypothetical protein
MESLYNEVTSRLASTTPLFNSSPYLTDVTLADFLSEARPSNTNVINNPLGIQGLHRDLDEVIHMVDNIIVENRRHSLELLNYQSNIMYVIVNKLSPSLY